MRSCIETMGKDSSMRKVKTYKLDNNKSFEVLQTRMRFVLKKKAYQKTVLKKGTRKKKGSTPLPCDILFESEVPIELRDGIHIKADLFRPITKDKVPVIIAWSPYGNDFSGMKIEGVALSGYQKFEAPDPGFWVAHGYAVANIDIRGVNNSEGDMIHWGTQMGRDGADVVEWFARQDYCNGKVTFAGNSYLSISQWFIAAERPEHLACIAPWEGFSDVYHHNACAGGIPDYEFEKLLSHEYPGHGMRENLADMIKQYPFMNDYWADKIARLDKINVPAYVVASYTNKVHTRGTLDSYQKLASKEKWLRVHNSHEWRDFYENQEDLLRFFDYYTKEIENGWKDTPPVRLCILNPGGTGIVNRSEQHYPLERTSEKIAYLDAASHRILNEPVANKATAIYQSDDNKGQAVFDYVFKQDTEIVGEIKLHLYVSTDGNDDMDLFVMCQKLNEDGQELNVCVKGAPYSPDKAVPFEWGNGRCRVSVNCIPGKIKKLTSGEVVSVNVTLCPMGMLFAKGQKLRISISGFNPSVPELKMQKNITTINKGKHIIHTGGETASTICLPITEATS